MRCNKGQPLRSTEIMNRRTGNEGEGRKLRIVIDRESMDGWGSHKRRYGFTIHTGEASTDHGLQGFDISESQYCTEGYLPHFRRVRW